MGQASRHIPERCQRSLQVLDDFLVQYIGRWQIVQIVLAVVLQPEDIQAGLVAGHQVLIAIELEALDGGPLVAVARVVAGDEVLQVIEFERARLEREMLVGTQVIKALASEGIMSKPSSSNSGFAMPWRQGRW